MTSHLGFLSLGSPAGVDTETVAGANTTLASDVAAGATTIVVASATGIADNDYLRIGDTAETEIRQVAVSGVSGTTITLTLALARPHDSGDQVREVDGPGGSGVLEDLWDDEFTGFAFPASKQVVPLLGDGTNAAGNSALQQSAHGFREATLSFTAQSTADKDIVRGYDETSERITFTDYDGSTRDVRILSFEASLRGMDEWPVTVRLQELAEPVGP